MVVVHHGQGLFRITHPEQTTRPRNDDKQQQAEDKTQQSPSNAYFSYELDRHLFPFPLRLNSHRGNCGLNRLPASAIYFFCTTKPRLRPGSPRNIPLRTRINTPIRGIKHYSSCYIRQIPTKQREYIQNKKMRPGKPIFDRRWYHKGKTHSRPAFFFAAAWRDKDGNPGWQEDPMKQCSLENFTETLEMWLAQDYIRSVTIDSRGLVSFTFMDGVKDTLQITGCDRGQVVRACRHLSDRGIPVRER
jgi:hypothetical protein